MLSFWDHVNAGQETQSILERPRTKDIAREGPISAALRFSHALGTEQVTTEGKSSDAKGAER